MRAQSEHMMDDYTVDDMAAALGDDAGEAVAAEGQSEPSLDEETEAADLSDDSDDSDDEPAKEGQDKPDEDDAEDEEESEDEEAKKAKESEGEKEKPARSGYQRMKRKVAALEEEKNSLSQERDQLAETKQDVELKAHQALDIAEFESKRADSLEEENKALTEEIGNLRALLEREGLDSEAPARVASKTQRERELEAELEMYRLQQTGASRRQQWEQQQAKAAQEQRLEAEVQQLVGQVETLSKQYGVDRKDIAALSKMRGLSFEEAAQKLALLASEPARQQAQANSGAPKPMQARGAPRAKIKGTSVEDMEAFLAQRGG